MLGRLHLVVALAPLMSLSACGTDSTEAGGASDSGAPDGGSSPVAHIDRTGMTDVGTEPLDYADPNLWTCRPGNDPNECHTNLDATEFLPDGTTRVVPHERAESPAFDCFYVYPTVDLTGTTNTTNFADISHVQDALLSQAARFSRICEVYAPLYRQQAISVGGGEGGAAIGLAGDFALAAADVEAAFDYYLEHLSRGRKFVLMGHSQGTFMLSALITKRFENDAALRSRLVSALLIGGGPFVPEGETKGGSFQNLPACTAPGEVGCIVAYNAFASEAPPPENTVFGRAPVGREIICTSPPVLAGNTGRSKGAYLPKVINTPTFVPNLPAGAVAPVFDTPFALFPDVFRGACVKSGQDHYFEVTLDPPAGDQRAVAPYRNAGTELIGFGLHVSDYNLFLDDLIEAVRLQAEAALE